MDVISRSNCLNNIYILWEVVMYCSNCNEENADNANFCKECGKSFASSSKQDHANLTQRRANSKRSVTMSSWKFWIVLTLAVFCLMIISIKLTDNASYKAPVDLLFQGLNEKNSSKASEAFIPGAEAFAGDAVLPFLRECDYNSYTIVNIPTGESLTEHQKLALSNDLAYYDIYTEIKSAYKIEGVQVVASTEDHNITNITFNVIVTKYKGHWYILSMQISDYFD